MSKNKEFSDTSANRYSLALYELASESNSLSKIEENSHALLKLISNSTDFNDLINATSMSLIMNKKYDLNILYKLFCLWYCVYFLFISFYMFKYVFLMIVVVSCSQLL